MNIQSALQRLLDRQHLSGDQMGAAMHEVMTGEATPAQIGAFLVALRLKGETVDEVAAAARVMRELAAPVSLGDDDAIDIVGTGGDASNTFNISTCSALVAAAAGVCVAKHGNRSVSSKSGAADLLEAAGVNIDLDAGQVAECIRQAGIGFMFAPRHHSAMKHAIGPRRELGVRTIFNLLGPLTNPAGARSQVLGVYDPHWVRPMAEVLQQLGSEHVLVVHGDIGASNNAAANAGMDEISISGPTLVAELKDDRVSEYSLSPGDFGLSEAPLSAIQVSSAEASLALIQSVLGNEAGPARDIVALNAGAAIHVGGGAESIEAGVSRATDVIANGSAASKLDELIRITAGMAP